MFDIARKGFLDFREESDIRRRSVCLLASILLHAVFLFMLIFLNLRFRFNALEERVIPVRIASAEKMLIPDIGAGLLAGTDAVSGSSEIGPLNEQVKPGYRVVPETAVSQSSRPTSAGDKEERVSGIISDFDLSQGIQGMQPSDIQFDLSIYTGEKDTLPDEMERGSQRKDINISKYLYPGTSGIRPQKGVSQLVRYGSRREGYRARTSFRRSDYDLTPWAEEVMNKIHKNWIIPDEQGEGEKGRVGISVIVEKSGELSSLKIMNSSEIYLFDQSALKALRMSSPFPGLPEDFPHEKLEVVFLFQYDD